MTIPPQQRSNLSHAGLLAAILICWLPAWAIAQAPPGPSAGKTAWIELLQRRPYPYAVPLPESRRTELDGTYTKVVVAEAGRVRCRRCPDYAPEGGLWKLDIDRGVFRILHPESGWKSIATAIVAGERLLLANDPVCIDGIGVYRWARDQGRLSFEVIDDPCAIQLRAMNLAQQPWTSCRPPDTEAAVTGHWPVPEGCD